MNPRLFFHRQSLFGAMGCALACLLLSQLQFPQQTVFNAPHYQLSAPFVRWVTAGYWPAAVDALWISTLQEIAETRYTPENQAHAESFYTLATDPYFYELYEQGGILFLFYFKDSRAALSLLEKGVSVFENANPPKEFWTHPYTLYLFLAYVHGFLRSDWAAARQNYLKAAGVPGAPAYLLQMKTWLQGKDSETLLGRKILSLLIQNTEDPVEKEAYEEKLKQL